MQSLFLAIDGDDVGRKIEFFIVTNQIESLSSFFKTFQNAMILLSKNLQAKFEANIIFNGGDNLLAILNIDYVPLNELEYLRNEFAKASGATLSFGIGKNPRQAYLALKLAKASGKNKIEIFTECTHE